MLTNLKYKIIKKSSLIRLYSEENIEVPIVTGTNTVAIGKHGDVALFKDSTFMHVDKIMSFQMIKKLNTLKNILIKNV